MLLLPFSGFLLLGLVALYRGFLSFHSHASLHSRYPCFTNHDGVFCQHPLSMEARGHTLESVLLVFGTSIPQHNTLPFRPSRFFRIAQMRKTSGAVEEGRGIGVDREASGGPGSQGVARGCHKPVVTLAGETKESEVPERGEDLLELRTSPWSSHPFSPWSSIPIRRYHLYRAGAHESVLLRPSLFPALYCSHAE